MSTFGDLINNHRNVEAGTDHQQIRRTENVLCSQFFGILIVLASSFPTPSSRMTGWSTCVILKSSSRSYTCWTFSQPGHSSTAMGWIPINTESTDPKIRAPPSENKNVRSWIKYASLIPYTPPWSVFIYSPLCWRWGNWRWSWAGCGWGVVQGSWAAGQQCGTRWWCCILETQLASCNSQLETECYTASSEAPRNRSITMWNSVGVFLISLQTKTRSQSLFGFPLSHHECFVSESCSWSGEGHWRICSQPIISLCLWSPLPRGKPSRANWLLELLQFKFGGSSSGLWCQLLLVLVAFSIVVLVKYCYRVKQLLSVSVVFAK